MRKRKPMKITVENDYLIVNGQQVEFYNTTTKPTHIIERNNAPDPIDYLACNFIECESEEEANALAQSAKHGELYAYKSERWDCWFGSLKHYPRFASEAKNNGFPVRCCINAVVEIPKELEFTKRRDRYNNYHHFLELMAE